jgi:hypothetical protein
LLLLLVLLLLLLLKCALLKCALLNMHSQCECTHERSQPPPVPTASAGRAQPPSAAAAAAAAAALSVPNPLLHCSLTLLLLAQRMVPSCAATPRPCRAKPAGQLLARATALHNQHAAGSR